MNDIPVESSEYIEAQRVLIGSMLIDPSSVGAVLAKVKAGDFNDAVSRTVFSAISDLWGTGCNIDPVIVDSRLDGVYHSWIAETMQLTPSARNALAYADIVADCAALSSVRSIGMFLLDVRSVEDARSALSAVESIVQTRSRIEKISYAEGLRQLADWLEDPAPPQYLDFGMPKINQRVPVEKGDFVVLGAESSTGKTALAIQLAFNLARSGLRVGFFSLETQKEKISQRNAALTANVKLSQIKYKRANSVEIRRIKDAARDGQNLPLYIYNCPDVTVAEIRGQALADRLDAVFVDYVQLVDGPGNSSYERVTEISKALHKMAQALKVMTFAISQVTPPSPIPKDWHPTMNDLRDSKQLKQDADVILLLSKTTLASVKYFDVAKNKDGSCGHIYLHFDAPFMRFEVCDENGEVPAPPSKPKPQAIDGQHQFSELPDDEPLPF